MNEVKYVFEMLDATKQAGWETIALFYDWDYAEFSFFAYAARLKERHEIKRMDTTIHFQLNQIDCITFMVNDKGGVQVYRLRDYK